MFTYCERKCDHCGKSFLPAPMHIYKVDGRTRMKVFCSWGCMRANEKKVEKINAARRAAYAKTSGTSKYDPHYNNIERNNDSGT